MFKRAIESTITVPLIGFCAFSGSGKTTTVTALLPLLRTAGLSVAVIKHAHHDFDMDIPGKDSYEFRQAGAEQVLVAGKHRMAMIKEHRVNQPEPTLNSTLQCIDTGTTDLIIVEGFKHEHYPKIEICRPSLGKPRLYRRDTSVIAVACDRPLSDLPWNITQLDLNSTEQIAEFVLNYRQDHLANNPHSNHEPRQVTA